MASYQIIRFRKLGASLQHSVIVWLADTEERLLLRSVQQYPDDPCLGHRPIKYGQTGLYEWQTNKEIGETVDAIAGGIMQLGHKAHGRIGVYGISSPEWVIAMQVRKLPRPRKDGSRRYGCNSSSKCA